MSGWVKAAVAASLVASGALGAEPRLCPDPRFEVTAEDTDFAAEVCTMAARAVAQLEACSIPLTEPVRIEIKSAMPETCLGLYHCGTRSIELPTLPVMQSLRAAGSSLAHVAARPFFEGLLTHEMAHAAHDEWPCPYDSCRAAGEFIAYNMQTMALPPEDLALFEATLDVETPVLRDHLSLMIMLMAPHIFRKRAWVHLHQQPDPCGYLSDVLQGRIRIDQPRP